MADFISQVIGVLVFPVGMLFLIYTVGKHIGFWDKYLPVIRDKLFSGGSSVSGSLSRELPRFRFEGLSRLFRRE